MKREKVIFIFAFLILIIISLPKLQDKWVDFILKDYPITDYYTKILHQLEDPMAPEIIKIDGRKFTLASNVDEHKRLHLSVENKKISFLTGVIDVEMENRSDQSILVGENLNGLEFKSGDFWRLSPGDDGDGTEAALEIRPFQKTKVPFHINPRKMKKGAYRIICVYGVEGMMVIDYIELEY